MVKFLLIGIFALICIAIFFNIKATLKSNSVATKWVNRYFKYIQQQDYVEASKMSKYNLEQIQDSYQQRIIKYGTVKEWQIEKSILSYEKLFTEPYIDITVKILLSKETKHRYLHLYIKSDGDDSNSYSYKLNKSLILYFDMLTPEIW